MNEITFAKEYELMCKDLLALERQAREIDKKRKEAKATICDAMRKHNIKIFENDVLRLTYVDETTSTGIDLNAVKSDCPDIYEDLLEKYPKETKRSAYVKITAR